MTYARVGLLIIVYDLREGSLYDNRFGGTTRLILKIGTDLNQRNSFINILRETHRSSRDGNKDGYITHILNIL